jgi:hypothetical protein
MSDTRDVPISEVMPGVTLDLRKSDMVMSAICIAVVAPMEGDDRTPRLCIANTPGIDWITQRGMLSAALDVERGLGTIVEDLEEDE